MRRRAGLLFGFAARAEAGRRCAFAGAGAGRGTRSCITLASMHNASLHLQMIFFCIIKYRLFSTYRRIFNLCHMGHKLNFLPGNGVLSGMHCVLQVALSPEGGSPAPAAVVLWPLGSKTSGTGPCALHVRVRLLC